MNPAALKLAREIKALCFIDEDNGRGDEVRVWATLDEDIVAEWIDEALAQARLEGAKAMQKAAATIIWNMEKTLVKHTRAIKALDPQQVINESTGK